MKHTLHDYNLEKYDTNYIAAITKIVNKINIYFRDNKKQLHLVTRIKKGIHADNNEVALYNGERCVYVRGCMDILELYHYMNGLEFSFDILK